MNYHINAILTFDESLDEAVIRTKIQLFPIFRNKTATIEVQQHENAFTAHCTVIIDSKSLVDLQELKQITGAILASVHVEAA